MKKLSKIVLIFGAMAMIACGDKKEKDADEKTTIGTSTEETTQTREAASADAAEGDVVELTIEGDDQMRFNKNEFRVKAGQTVRLTLKHVGQMDKNAMGHNWVLLTKGTVINEFGMEAMDAKANDHIPEGTDKVIAHTKMLGGGESDTIEFTAPEKGTYDFICSFPGHYALMKGKFIVE